MHMKLITSLLLAASLHAPLAASAAPAPAAREIAAAGWVKGATVEGITEYRLANGLRVLLFPDSSKPTVTTNIVYLVGSRQEHYGETGMAHLLEHLLFKPSKNFSGKQGAPAPVEVLNAIGARFNGTTSYDRTNYYATFPSTPANLDRMLALEADRMVNANISRDDLWNPATKTGEMTVVRNEFEMGESDPLRVTADRVRAVAFDWHNYGKAPIGTRSDIEQVDIDHLRSFYRRYYRPDNAVLIVAGNFDEAGVLKQVQGSFGRVPRPDSALPATYTAEPAQDGERSVTVRRSGGVQLVSAGYHVAPSGHADAAALEVLTRILADTPGGRLHKALVAAGLATRLQSGDITTREPGYLQFGAIVPKGGDLDKAGEELLRVLEGIAAQPVSEAEVARARQQVLKSIDMASNDTARLAIALTDAVAAGDWRLFFVQRDRMAEIDARAVQAAAEKYLKAGNRTLGRFIPTEGAERTIVPANIDVDAVVKAYKGRAAVRQGESFDATPAAVEGRVERITLANGMQAALLGKATKGGTVNVSLKLRIGTPASLTGKSEVGQFAAALLSMGTAAQSRQQVRDALDRLQAQVNIQGGAEGVTVSVQTVRENINAVMDLVAQQLMTPAYPEKEFMEYQRERIARSEQSATEPQPLAMNAFQRMLNPFPVGHPIHAMSLPQAISAQKAVTLEQVRAFHEDFYGAQNATVAVVGDFDSPRLKQQLAALFGNWRAAQPYERVARAYKQSTGEHQVVATPDKANSIVVAAYPVQMRDDDSAYPSALIANYMLGGGTMRNRLADRIRQKDGLSYAVGSQLMVPARDAAGLWLATAVCAPQNAARVEASLFEEIEGAVRSGFTQAELDAAKSAWAQARQVSRAGDGTLAATLSEYLSLGRTMAFDQALEAKVAGLTLTDVNQAVLRLFVPAAITVVKAGDFEGKGAAGAVL